MEKVLAQLVLVVATFAIFGVCVAWTVGEAFDESTHVAITHIDPELDRVTTISCRGNVWSQSVCSTNSTLVVVELPPPPTKEDCKKTEETQESRFVTAGRKAARIWSILDDNGGEDNE